MKKSPVLYPIFFCLMLIGIMLGGTGCLDDGHVNSLEHLRFSRDTVFFDTVFTTMGTSTQSLKLYNNGNQTIQINRIRLNNGSVFRFNADGTPGPEVNDLQILPGDSAFVFIEATPDPNQANGILIHEEHLFFENDLESKSVVLAVPAADAIFYLPSDTLQGSGIPYSILPCNTVWKPGKPIVVVGYLVVDSLCFLKIEAGTEIYMYRNAALWIYRGATLNIQGEQHFPVTFQGTRRGFAYEELPGQWDRILINDGAACFIRNTLIKNAFIGLQADHMARLNGQDGPGSLRLENVEIRNCSGLGIFSRGMDIEAYNLLVHNCGQYAAAFTLGGTHNIYHSGILNFWNRSNRQTPALILNNYFVSGQNIVSYPLNFNIYNSLIYGNLENEFEYDSVPGQPIHFRFDHCALRVSEKFSVSDPLKFPKVWKNLNPGFENVNNRDYRLKTDSPLKDSASPAIVQQFPFQLTFDIYGKNRTMTLPDPGAIER